ncbi:DUF202 domain-containing protein [Acerihabitans sp. KWT182]|uniref:DUF202 domain-containing protein n=1 Tax=Acerihabitans sp. KWT182 TaxID=3157919 RepID=A0AAU7Q657_9GAMM
MRDEICFFNNNGWQRQGKDPDYRFSLANERTFLAWIRTALGFLAGSIALDQLASGFASPLIRSLLAIFLSLGGALLALVALRRWEENEKAMRNDRPLPYTRLLAVISALVVLTAFCFILFILIGGWG